MTTITGFSGPLDTRYEPAISKTLGVDYWAVLSQYSFVCAYEGSVWQILVYRGMLTDGASVPRIFKNLLPSWGVYGQAAGGHDLLCRTLKIIKDGVEVSITRAQADEFFLQMMIALGVPEETRNTMYDAVRAYAIAARINKPSDTQQLRDLEAAWIAANPETPVPPPIDQAIQEHTT